MTEFTKMHFIELRYCEGTEQRSLLGKLDFMPDNPEFKWPYFRVIGKDKNSAIDEIIAKLKSLKE